MPPKVFRFRAARVGLNEPDPERKIPAEPGTVRLEPDLQGSTVFIDGPNGSVLNLKGLKNPGDFEERAVYEIEFRKVADAPPLEVTPREQSPARKTFRAGAKGGG